MNLAALGLLKSSKGVRARGRVRHRDGEMNKSEQSFAHHLEIQRRTGLALWWAFEPVTLRLAKNTTYKPDFLVVAPDGLLICYEVKAWWKNINGPGWEDDARVKIKTAAEIYPFEFRAAALKPNGEWHIEVF